MVLFLAAQDAQKMRRAGRLRPVCDAGGRNTSRAAMEHAMMILNVWDAGALNAEGVVDRYEDAALR